MFYIFENYNNKSLFIDFLRVFACIAIIGLHVQHTFLADDPSIEWIIKRDFRIFETSLQWAVPTFLIITGYIFLGIKDNVTYKSLFKYFLRFFLIIFFINTFFNIIENYYYQASLNFELIYRSFFMMINGKSFGHMWYMHTIFAIYLLLPVLNPFFKNSKDRDIIIFTVLNFLIILFLPMINKYLPFKIYFEHQISWTLLYTTLGGFFYRFSIKNTKANNISMIVLLIFCFCINIYFAINNGIYLSSYCNTCLAYIESFLIFNIARNCLNYENKIFKFLKDYTLDIFIYHVIFIHLATKYFKLYPLRFASPHLMLAIWIVIIFVLSLILSMFLMPIENLVLKKLSESIDFIGNILNKKKHNNY